VFPFMMPTFVCQPGGDANLVALISCKHGACLLVCSTQLCCRVLHAADFSIHANIGSAGFMGS
jgi:hypothetical protein